MNTEADVIALLCESNFNDAKKMLDQMPETTETIILKCFTLFSRQKTYTANFLIRDKLEMPAALDRFSDLAKKANIDRESIYKNAVADGLGYAIWISMDDKTANKDEKIELLANSMGLQDKHREGLYKELLSQDNSTKSLLRYAYAAASGSRKNELKIIRSFVTQAIEKALLFSSDNAADSLDVYVKAARIAFMMCPPDVEQAIRLIEKAFAACPENKSEILSLYIYLYAESDGQSKPGVLHDASRMARTLEELITCGDTDPTAQMQRLLYYNRIDKNVAIFRKEEVDRLAEKIFMGLDHNRRAALLDKLGYDNDVDEDCNWNFVKQLLAVFIREDTRQKTSSLYLLKAHWQFGVEKLNTMLTELAKKYKARYIVGLIRRQVDADSGTNTFSGSVFNRIQEMYQQSDPAPEAVSLGAAAPQSAAKGTGFTARFVVYGKGLETEIEKSINALAPGSYLHKGINKFYWQRGTKVNVRLSGDGLNVDDDEETFVWDDDAVLIDFDVTVKADTVLRKTVLKFDVYIDRIRVAKIRVDLEIVNNLLQTASQFVRTEPIKSAFASYSSLDRDRVLDRVTEIRRNGVDVYLDQINMEPGDQWQIALAKEIREREAFFLFWSVNAIKSDMVSWEWRFALQEKGIDAIQPHPLDTVAEAPPPNELKSLHFGDLYMLVRKANMDG